MAFLKTSILWRKGLNSGGNCCSHFLCRRHRLRILRSWSLCFRHAPHTNIFCERDSVICILYVLPWQEPTTLASTYWYLGADHLTLEGGGGWFWKKISCKRLSEEKNCMQHKCNRKLMGKKGKKYPAHHISRKKNSWWPEVTHPLPQELNGRPLMKRSRGNEELKGVD